MSDGKGTIVLPCTCKDEQQDGIYGHGMRLHNKDTKNPKTKKAYCTVCSPSQSRTLKHIPPDFPAPVFGALPSSFPQRGGKIHNPGKQGKSF